MLFFFYVCAPHVFHWISLNHRLCLYVHREQVQRSEESRQQSMKPSPSQHSFDSAILDGSLPDENLSVDSDISDSFVVLLDSGV